VRLLSCLRHAYHIDLPRVKVHAAAESLNTAPRLVDRSAGRRKVFHCGNAAPRATVDRTRAGASQPQAGLCSVFGATQMHPDARVASLDRPHFKVHLCAADHVAVVSCPVGRVEDGRG